MEGARELPSPTMSASTAWHLHAENPQRSLKQYIAHYVFDNCIAIFISPLMQYFIGPFRPVKWLQSFNRF
jgi:hypothetical protein